MTEPTRTQTETSDGILLRKLEYLRGHLARFQETGETVTIHAQSHGLVTVGDGVKVKAVSLDGATLAGKFVLLVGPQQAQQLGGTLYLPLIDIMRVFQPDQVQLASGTPKA